MLYSYRAMVWAGKVGISCTIDSARKLHYKFLCSRHFSESAFTTAERVHLNRFAVPCGSDSAAQSLPLPTLVATGKHFMLLLWMQWLIVRTSFQSYCPQNPVMISYCPQNPVVIKQTSLLSFITSETVYQYTGHVEYVTCTNVFRIIKKCLKSGTCFQ
jgi:hypothetical protein